MEKEITLVTAYYELPKKKFSSETYIDSESPTACVVVVVSVSYR